MEEKYENSTERLLPAQLRRRTVLHAAMCALALALAGITVTEVSAATRITSLPFTDTATAKSQNQSWTFTYTPASDMTLDANTIGSGYDTYLYVYQGRQLIGEDDDDGGGLTSRFTFSATAGVTYKFVVTSYCKAGGFKPRDCSSGTGTMTFNLQVAP